MISTLTERTDHAADDTLEKLALAQLKEPELSVVEEHIFCCQHCQTRLDETDAWTGLMRAALGIEIGQEAAVRKPMASTVEYGIGRVEPNTFARQTAGTATRETTVASESECPSTTDHTGSHVVSLISGIGKQIVASSGFLGSNFQRLACAGVALALAAFVIPAGSWMLTSPAAPTEVILRAERGGSVETAPAGKPLRLSISAAQAEGVEQGAVVDLDGNLIVQGSLKRTAPGDDFGSSLEVPKGLSAGRYWFRLLGLEGTTLRECQLIVK